MDKIKNVLPNDETINKPFATIEKSSGEKISLYHIYDIEGTTREFWYMVNINGKESLVNLRDIPEYKAGAESCENSTIALLMSHAERNIISEAGSCDMQLTINTEERDALRAALNMAMEEMDLYISCDDLTKALDEKHPATAGQEPSPWRKARRQKDVMSSLLQRIKTA